MQPGTATVVGILAGGGALPREIADAVRAAGHRVVIVGLEGEVEPGTFGPHDLTVVNWGQIGRLIGSFKTASVTDLVIVGRVNRPDLWRIKTDLGFYRNLPRILRIIAAGGDDSVLRRVVRFFEGHGFRVRGPSEVAPGLVIGPGPLGARTMGPEQQQDVDLGFDLVARLAPFDIGQAVVVARGRVLAIEGVEGTDAMLRRVAAAGGSRGGVLVKRPKPGQELRVDMPAIGPQTVARVAEAGLAGIAVEAGATLAAERAQLIRCADEQGVFVAGVPLPAASRPAARAAAPDGANGDAVIGARVLAALGEDGLSRGVVVMRRHVLAVETGEGLKALIARALGLRQWGRGLANRRRGALTVASLADLGDAELQAAASAGYAFILACRDGGVPQSRSAKLHALAARARIALRVGGPEANGGGA